MTDLSAEKSHLATKTLSFTQIQSLIDRCSVIARLETAENTLRSGKWVFYFLWLLLKNKLSDKQIITLRNELEKLQETEKLEEHPSGIALSFVDF